MQIVIVEDRPWRLETSIVRMKEIGIDVKCIIYVRSEYEMEDESQFVKEMCQRINITNEEIYISNFDDFEPTMDKYYQKEDNLFLVDLNLLWGKRVYFEDYLPVKYARKVMRNEEKNLSRIWFYTTAGENSLEQINVNFPRRNISVKALEGEQVILDMDEVQIAFKGYINES